MITYPPIDKNKVQNFISDIQQCIQELEVFKKMNLEEFKKDRHNYGLAEHYLRRSLEGVLTIGTHILSRLPAKSKDYSQIILSLGEFNIIPQNFAEKNKKLAGYRNRLVHMYWEVSFDELHQIIQQHLNDLDEFCKYFQDVLKNPEKFNLTIT
jgi:uncharacterized protein YutE (UPF0331/DUF86 family)